MSVTFQLPDSIEKQLRDEYADLDQAAKEALAIEGYRVGKLGLREVADILGLETRIEAQSWLGQRKVPLNYDLDDLETDRRSLAKHFPEMGEWATPG